MENVTFDYKFYRIPKRFFKEDTFRDMTNAAKVLYGILLDRKCLSDSNGDAWRDEYGICNDIFNHTSLCEFHQGKLLLHLTIPFEEKPKTNLPSDNLRYYRQRKQMTTRQLAEKLNIVPATIVMYENGKHPIPYDVSIKLADVLEIEASLLYDDFSRFLAVPYTEALKSVRTALGLSQKAFAEQIGIVPSYYYKIEEGNRRPSRKVYQKICAALEATGRQTSLLWAQPLQ